MTETQNDAALLDEGASSEAQVNPPQVTDVLPLNPATSLLLQAFGELQKTLAQISKNTERQEEPAPGLFRLPLQTSVRIRATGLVILPAAAGTYRLMVGTAPLVTFVAPANGVLGPIKLPVTIERGVQLEILTAAGVRVTAAEIADQFLLGYPE